jgi:hypothetical protein
MTANLKNPRPDIVYLRRRLKRGEQLPEVKQTANISLTLTEDELPGQPPVEALPTTPTLTKDSILGAAQPVLRLNRRQSAIGSLALANVAYVGWEMVDGTTGFLYSNVEAFHGAGGVNHSTGEPREALPEVTPKAFKKRPVLQFVGNELVVGLRHVKELKRFVAVPVPDENISVTTSNKLTILLPHSENAVLYGSVVESCVEFREEKFRGNIHETFRIGTYHPPTTSS